MFHIVFSCDENYVKYLSVLLTSIVKNTDTSRNFSNYAGGGEQNAEGYVFHILSDTISKETQNKLQILEQELSTIYPCEILIHFVDESIFTGVPKWGFEQQKNYAAYYRLTLSQFIPQDVKKCLYLDVDMLVMCDIRELFAIDLGECIAGVNSGFHPGVMKSSSVEWILESANKQGMDFKMSSIPYYFCSGLMLLNMPLYRAGNIESQCLIFLKNYKPLYADQDALNVVLNGKTKILDAEYGVLINFACALDKKKGKEALAIYKKTLPFTKIAHLNGCSKPWFSPSKNIASHNKIVLFHPYYQQWWSIALQTPAFQTELARIKNTHRDYFSLAFGLISNILKKIERTSIKPLKNFIKYTILQKNKKR